MRVIVIQIGSFTNFIEIRKPSSCLKIFGVVVNQVSHGTISNSNVTWWIRVVIPSILCVSSRSSGLTEEFEMKEFRDAEGLSALISPTVVYGITS
jgi:hypothetical protein